MMRIFMIPCYNIFPTCPHAHMPIPNNPTAYTPVTRVAIVGVTALS